MAAKRKIVYWRHCKYGERERVRGGCVECTSEWLKLGGFFGRNLLQLAQHSIGDLAETSGLFVHKLGKRFKLLGRPVVCTCFGNNLISVLAYFTLTLRIPSKRKIEKKEKEKKISLSSPAGKLALRYFFRSATASSRSALCASGISCPAS